MLQFPCIIIFLSLNIDFVLANNADPYEMPHYALSVARLFSGLFQDNKIVEKKDVT